MRIAFTTEAVQIAEDEYLELQESEPITPNPFDPVRIHHADPGEMGESHYLYDHEEQHLCDAYGGYYFRTEDHSELQVDVIKWFAFIEDLSEFFLGVDQDVARRNPSAYTGLPFANLVCFPAWRVLYPPMQVHVLKADFKNVASDGADNDFFDYLHIDNQFVDHHHDLYQSLRTRVDAATRRYGSFYYAE